MTPTNLIICEENRPTEVRIKIKIPQQYHQKPILNFLAVNHNIEISIIGALLGSEKPNDGYFDLLLQGDSKQINDALVELAELDIEVWHISGQEIDGW
jgi:hypothetical protein